MIKEKINDEESKEMFDVINRNIEHIKNLVTKTLQLARLNSPQMKLNFENIYLKEEIDSIISRNNFMFLKYKIDVNNNINSEFQINVDRLRFGELIDNILNNAVKYSPKGGMVDINAVDNDDFIIISIRDEGMGMTKEQINHIFKEFYKVDTSRHDFDSSGLGMSICKRIVEFHDGKIWAESDGLGKGTTVYFLLSKSLKTNIETIIVKTKK
jgi:two-component system sensor histidine kinase VicK